MRAREFKPKTQLAEIAMNPKSLQAAAASIPARVGMEFEMYVPNVKTNEYGDEPAPDYSYDQIPDSIKEIVDFFDDGNHNLSSDITRLRSVLEREFDLWQTTKIDEYIKKNIVPIVVKYLIDKRDINRSLIDDNMIDDILDDPIYSERIANWARKHPDDYIDDIRDFNEEKWLDDIGITSMRLIAETSSYDISWPYYQDSLEDSASLQDIAQYFMHAMGHRRVAASESYHGMYSIWNGTTWTHKGNKKPTDCYSVEPDGSLDEPSSRDDAGVEFVSPPLSLKQMAEDLNKVKAWANQIGAYTNESTGLHINISIKDVDADKVDIIKLAVLLGDEYILEQFQRESNKYCTSALSKIQQFKDDMKPDVLENYMIKISQGLEAMANKIIMKTLGSKYTSIHPQLGYIEFRSPGDDWLGDKFDLIEDTMLRMVVALDAACDPQKHRQEYLKKLYKLMAPEGVGDPIRFFAMHAAGEMDRETLKFALQNMLRAPKTSVVTATAPEQSHVGRLHRWAILMGGEKVYEFNAPNQGVANTYARNWLSSRSEDFLGAHAGQEVEVVPLASTSPQEYRPQDAWSNQ